MERKNKKKVLLTNKQKKFIKEYLKDLNGTKAAVRSGYSKKTASQQASRLLRNVKVLEKLKSEIQKINNEEKVDIKNIIKELKLIAFSRITDYCDFNNDNVTINNSALIDADKLSAIETIIVNENDKGSFKKLKLHSKINALSRLLDYLELMNDDENKNSLKIQLIRKIMKS